MDLNQIKAIQLNLVWPQNIDDFTATGELARKVKHSNNHSNIQSIWHDSASFGFINSKPS